MVWAAYDSFAAGCQRIGARGLRKQESSFSEEKEAKRLL
jgi:hypothetical protein